MCMQALILCQRYADARSGCVTLPDGVDKLYLQAEAAWRTGSLQEAVGALQAALALRPDSRKCAELQQLVQPLLQHESLATGAFEQGGETTC